MVTSPPETWMPEPDSENILLSPSSLIFALESPTSMASPSLLMFTSSMVTFAVAPSEVDIVMVLSVAAAPSRCEMTGASSATAAPPPCDTVCPELSALTVMSPSSRYQSAANADTGIPIISTSAIMPDMSRFIFIECALLPTLYCRRIQNAIGIQSNNNSTLAFCQVNLTQRRGNHDIYFPDQTVVCFAPSGLPGRFITHFISHLPLKYER